MTPRRAFACGFYTGAVLCLGTCLAGCTSEDRAGHRLEASVLRMDAGGSSSSSSAVSDGPGPHDSSASSSSSSDGDGWVYGIGYSIPVGDHEGAHEQRQIVAHLAGLRADIDRLAAAVAADRAEPVVVMVPAPAHTEPAVPPQTPASEGETQPSVSPPSDHTTLYASIGASLLGLVVAWLKRKALAVAARGVLSKLKGGADDEA